MSIIAIDGVPVHWQLKHVMTAFSKIVPGRFEALNFQQKQKSSKTCYARVSEKLDPLQVIEKINRISKAKRQLMKAYIPEDIPDLPIEQPVRKKFKPAVPKVPIVSKVEKPEFELIKTHFDIMRELQTKYTGLHSLSKKTGHKLLEKLAQVICERLKIVIERNAGVIDSSYQLGKAYRIAHPHFADFQFVLSNLHQIEDEAKKPRTQISEADLMTVSISPYVVENVPYNNIIQVAYKYNEKIINVFNDHIKSLDTNLSASDSEEEIARKKVRVELAKLGPHLSTIIKQVMTKHVSPVKTESHTISIYGEPSLPTKGLKQFLARHRASRAFRSRRVHNLLRVTVPTAQYGSLITMDGTVIGGSKLVIRQTHVEVMKCPDGVVSALKAVVGVAHDPQDRVHEHHLADNNADWAQLPLNTESHDQ